MSEKLIIFILLVVYLARPKQPDEIQISGEMKSGCFYTVRMKSLTIFSGELHLLHHFMSDIAHF